MGFLAFSNERYRQLLEQATQNAYGVQSAEEAALGGDYGVLGATGKLLNIKLGGAGARRGVITASRGVNQAQSAVLGAESASLAGRRSLLGLTGAQIAAAQADEATFRAARGNLADKTAVAQEALLRGKQDARYRMWGEAPPVDVTVAPGATGSLGLGTRPALQTQEDIVRGQNADKEKDRQFQYQQAKNAVDLIDTNVTEAEIAARRAGLTLNEAKLLVDENEAAQYEAGLGVEQAKLGASYLDLGVSGAKLASSRTGLDINAMKSAGLATHELYRDPYTGEYSWQTPAEADSLEYGYQQDLASQRIPGQYALSQQRTQYANQQLGLGGLSTESALSLLGQGKLPPSVTPEALHKALVKQGMDPNVAFNLIADQQKKAQQAATTNAMAYFDDSDFVWFLSQGSLNPDPWEVNRPAQVRQALMAKYPGISPQALEVKMQQYLSAAKAQQAKLRDEQAASGGTRQPSTRQPSR